MPYDTPRLAKAYLFAINAHRGQQRKYTGEPYVLHCFAVADTVRAVGGTEDMQIAAMLHDTVEDTAVTIQEVLLEFGMEVALMVHTLTDYYTAQKFPNLNRKERKKYYKEWFKVFSTPETKTIKLADLLDNTKSILQHDPNFAKIYLQEKWEMLPLLAEGNKELYQQAKEICKKGLTELHIAVD